MRGPRPRSVMLAQNLLLMATSFMLTILVTIGADRLIGLASPDTPGGTGTIPAGGLALPPHSRVRYETVEFVSTASVNALGFRGPDMSIAKPPDTTRIVAIGDSYTYGWGVDDDETWPLLLEHGLRQRGYFARCEINASLCIISLTAPDYFRRYLNLDSVETQERITELAVSLRRIRTVAKPYGARVLVVCAPHGPYVSPRTLAGFRRVGFRMDEGMLSSESPDRTIALAAGQARTPHVSVTEAFRRTPNVDALYYPLDGHMTPTGAAYFARTLEPIVAEYVRQPKTAPPLPEHKAQ